jgi:prepilin-type N-terminal cleavage/methylation domain-containing protein
MEMSQSHHHKQISQRGYTMLEVLFAMIILAVGMIALSSLAAQTMAGTAQSRFIGLSASLVSEKLEDLNRWPTWDPHVCVASGTTAGSLTADLQAASLTCNSITDTVDYYDDVEISDSNGAVCETVSSISGGAQLYTTTCHQSNGLIATTTSMTANTADIGAVAFHRRWTIEMDQPITGLKRMTVKATLENGFMQPPVSFQLSLVRP